MAFIVQNPKFTLTAEAVQDLVGPSFADSSTIDFTYNDAGDSITASVIQAGLDHGSIGGLSDDDHAQYFKVTGRNNENLVMSGTGKIGLTDGTISAPSLFFNSDTDTGIWRVSANIMALNAGGVAALGVRDTDILLQVPLVFFPGNTLDVGAGGSTPRDVYIGRNLDVTGNASVTGKIFVTGGSDSAPGIAAIGDTNTGIYWPGTSGQIRVTSDGVIAMEFGQTGFNISTLPFHVYNAACSVEHYFESQHNADPGAPTDAIRIGAQDTTAGTARTLHLRTEEAVAVDAALASTHSLSVWINGAEYKILLTAV